MLKKTNNGLLFVITAAVLVACAPDNNGEASEEGVPEDPGGAVEESTEENAEPVDGSESGLEGNGEVADSSFNDPETIAEMRDENDEEIGEVSFFTDESGETIVYANVEGLDQGFHGFHIHENGVCESDAEEGPFTTAEGHYAPESEDHGAHAGDMPPLYVNEDGDARMMVELDRFTPEQLVSDGTAVIIHGDPDNFANIPDRYQSSEQEEPGPDQDTLNTGDAGDRVACGVVEQAG